MKNSNHSSCLLGEEITCFSINFLRHFKNVFSDSLKIMTYIAFLTWLSNVTDNVTAFLSMQPFFCNSLPNLIVNDIALIYNGKLYFYYYFIQFFKLSEFWFLWPQTSEITLFPKGLHWKILDSSWSRSVLIFI